MQTTAIRTVAKSLPQNKVILLTCLISNSYIPYTDLRKELREQGYLQHAPEALQTGPDQNPVVIIYTFR